jgi:hypothetical protein
LHGSTYLYIYSINSHDKRRSPSGFVEGLSDFHNQISEKRTYQLHCHIYENLIRPGHKPLPDIGIEDTEELEQEARELSIREALALLEKKEFTPTRTTLLQKIGKFNQMLSSDTSVFAFKAAAAASVFATLSMSPPYLVAFLIDNHPYSLC